MNNSDKLIYTQGNASTFARGTDGRLMYNGIDGEDKKYLIEGEGGGSTSAPSALVEPQLDNFEYVNTSYNDYTHTITISTKRQSSDYSGIKFIDKIEGDDVEIITINSSGSSYDASRSLALKNLTDVSINCNEFYIKNGNNYRFQSCHWLAYDPEIGEEYESDDFEINAQARSVETKIFSDMKPERVNAGIVWTSNTGIGIVKRQFELRCIQTHEGDDLKFQIVARTVDESQQEVEQVVFETKIQDDGTIIGPDGNQVE